ncbi:hypothetical protein KKE78_05245 [Patescibacteria group bacterium]|nr:hypothetical protein [Patescibacteria group bacterium]
MKLYPNVSIIFCIWVLAVFSIFYLGFSSVPHVDDSYSNFLVNLGSWDGGHYLGIAETGYSEKFQYAFFPLYPVAIKILNLVTHNYLSAGVLVSMTSTFLGLHLLYILVKKDFDKKIAERTVLAFLFFPTSFFLLTVYSEGLFFFLAVLTFYFLRQKKLFWAVVAAIFVSATRLVGLAVAAGLMIEVIVTQGFSRKNWYILFAPLGLVIYCIYLYQQTGDPLYFITAENHWQRIIAFPGVGFWETIRQITDGGFVKPNINFFRDLIFAIFGVGFTIRSFRFLPMSLAIFALVAVVIPLFTPTLSSMPRFLLVVFPLFIVAALIKNRFISFAYLLFSVMTLGLFASLFINGYWVS